MPPSKIPNSVSKLILELADQQKEPAEIAQILNLKKVQVTTLLAYHKLIESKARTQEIDASTTTATDEPVVSQLDDEDMDDEPQTPDLSSPLLPRRKRQKGKKKKKKKRPKTPASMSETTNTGMPSVGILRMPEPFPTLI